MLARARSDFNRTVLEWSKRSNQEKTTPRPRPGCIVHPGFPAVLAPCRPLRNSHVHVLRHARFPLQAAPLLGAPQGTPFSFDPASCLVLEASFRFEVLGQGRERSVSSRAEASGCGCGFAPVPRPQVLLQELPQIPGRKPGRRNPGPLGSAEERRGRRGKASMSEHRDVRVAQRPADTEHHRGPGAPDARPARTRGASFLVTSFWANRKK